ncbi:hypothetical protein D3C73_856510 [compost metagenome]
MSKLHKGIAQALRRVLLQIAQTIEISHRSRVRRAGVPDRTQAGSTLRNQARQRAKRFSHITGVQRLTMQQRVITATDQFDRPSLSLTRSAAAPAQPVVSRQLPHQGPNIDRLTVSRHQSRRDDVQRLAERRSQLTDHHILQIQRSALVEIAKRQNGQR